MISISQPIQSLQSRESQSNTFQKKKTPPQNTSLPCVPQKETTSVTTIEHKPLKPQEYASLAGGTLITGGILFWKRDSIKNQARKARALVTGETLPLSVVGMADTYDVNLATRRFSAIDRLVKTIEQDPKQPEVLAVMAGDAYSPTPFSAKFKGQEMQALWNWMAGYFKGNFLMELGNHEFDYDHNAPEKGMHLKKIIQDAPFPHLAANLIDKTDNKLGHQPYAIRWVNGLKVLVVGLLTPDTFQANSPLGKQFDLKDPLKQLQTMLPTWQAQHKPALTILVTHLEDDLDQQIADALKGKVHGTIGGHTHEVYQANLTETPSQQIKHNDGQMQFSSTLTPTTPAPIMKAGMDLMGVGTLQYGMQRNGANLVETMGNILKGQPGFKPVKVKATHYDLTSITSDSIPYSDLEKAIPHELQAEMQRLLTPLKPVKGEWKAKKADLRGGPSAVQNFWNDLLKRHIETNYREHLPYPDKPVLVVWQASGTRSQDEATFPLPSATQPLRLLDPIIYNPFTNKAVCLGMTGRELKKALEQGASHLADHLTGSDRMLSHPSGFTYTLDLTKPKQQRISNLCLTDGTPIQEDAVLNVVFNEYVAQGGDGCNLGELYQQRLKDGKMWTSDELVSALYTQQLQQETTESPEPFVLDDKPRFKVIQRKR